jgi:hypothetical protein
LYQGIAFSDAVRRSISTAPLGADVAISTFSAACFEPLTAHETAPRLPKLSCSTGRAGVPGRETVSSASSSGLVRHSSLRGRAFLQLAGQQFDLLVGDAYLSVHGSTRQYPEGSASPVEGVPPIGTGPKSRDCWSSLGIRTKISYYFCYLPVVSAVE